MEKEILDLCKVAVLNTIKNGIDDYLKNSLFGYSSPFYPLIKEAVKDLESIKILLKDSVDEVVQDPEFKNEFKTALRKRLVNELVKSFDVEKTFKEMRNNPEAKERLLKCLEGMVK